MSLIDDDKLISLIEILAEMDFSNISQIAFFLGSLIFVCKLGKEDLAKRILNIYKSSNNKELILKLLDLCQKGKFIKVAHFLDEISNENLNEINHKVNTLLLSLNPSNYDQTKMEVSSFKNKDDYIQFTIQTPITNYSILMADLLIDSRGIFYKNNIKKIYTLDFIKEGVERPSEFFLHVHNVLTLLNSSPIIPEFLSQIHTPSNSNSAASLLIKKMFELDPRDSLSDRHVRVAILSALLSWPRQDNDLGSCFLSHHTIHLYSSDEGILEVLELYKEIVETDAISKKIYGSAGEAKKYHLILDTLNVNTNNYKNLMMSALESIFASLSYSSTNVLHKEHHNRFFNLKKEECFYKSIYEKSITPYLTQTSDLSLKKYLSSLKAIFDETVHPYYYFNMIDDKTKLRGSWLWTTFSTQKSVHTAPELQKIHDEVVCIFNSIYTSHFTPVGNTDFLHPLTRSFTIPEESKLYKSFSGSSLNELKKNYYGIDPHQFRSRFNYQATEEFLGMLINFCETLPSSIQNEHLSNKTRLMTICTETHVFNFIPASLCSILRTNLSKQDIINKLRKRELSLDSEEEASKILQLCTKIKEKFDDLAQILHINSYQVKNQHNICINSFVPSMLSFINKIKTKDAEYRESLLEYIDISLHNIFDSENKIKLGDLNWASQNKDTIYLTVKKSYITNNLCLYEECRNQTIGVFEGYHTDNSTKQGSVFKPYIKLS